MKLASSKLFAIALLSVASQALPAQTVVSVGALGENSWTNTVFANNNTNSSNFAFAQQGLLLTANSTQVAGIGLDNITTGFGSPSGLFNTVTYNWSTISGGGDQVLFKMTIYGLSSGTGTPLFLGTLYYGQAGTGGTETITAASLFYSSRPGLAGVAVDTLQNLSTWVTGFESNAGIVAGSVNAVSLQLAVGSSGAHSPYVGQVSQLSLEGGTFGVANGGSYTVNFVPEPGTYLAGALALAVVGGLVGRRLRLRRAV